MRAASLLALLCACGSGPAVTAECPRSGHLDPARATRLADLLRSSPEGRALADGWLAGVRAICFDEGTLSVVTHEHVVLLDGRMSDAEAAARLGHLLVHERDGHPMAGDIGPESDCAALVHEAIGREARAYAAESRLRAAFDVRDPVMPFEIAGETAALADADATARWLAYLEAHPSGAPGIDALGAGYLAQCERDRAAHP
jgi:hypothetical protein